MQFSLEILGSRQNLGSPKWQLSKFGHGTNRLTKAGKSMGSAKLFFIFVAEPIGFPDSHPSICTKTADSTHSCTANPESEPIDFPN